MELFVFIYIFNNNGCLKNRDRTIVWKKIIQ